MAPSLEERHKTLKLKREAFKLELETFQLLIDSPEAGDSGSQIQVHFDELESEYTVFNKTQADLDSADTTGELMRERIALKSAFSTCKARAMDILNRLTPRSQIGGALGVESLSLRASPQSTVESVDRDVYLPKINLPTFAGAYEDWPGFADQFQSSIHENVRINECKKLLYLRSCLKDEAAKAIESVGNSAANYKVAWDLLAKRYNQPATIVTNHLRAIVDVPLLQKPSYRDFRTFLNNMEAHYRALQSLKQPSADTVLIHLIVSKLDEESALKWKERTRGTAFPSLEELFTFLHDRYQMIEPVGGGEPTTVASAVVPAVAQGTVRNRQGPQNRNKPAVRELRSNTQVHSTQNAILCSFCREPHFSQNCSKLLNLSVPERSKLVKESHLCFNCLRPNHSVRDCQASTCRRCHKRHHTLLHVDPTPVPAAVQVNNTCSIVNARPTVILCTAVIDIVDGFGKTHKCRVLLDSCAESHFLSERMCRQLNLPTEAVNIPLCGTNAMQSASTKLTRAQIKSRNSRYSKNVTFLIVREVSQPLPHDLIDRQTLKIPVGIHLADPDFHMTSNIDGILGGQFFWDLMCIGRIVLANQCTKLQKTQLGWIVVGHVPDQPSTQSATCNLTLNDLQTDMHKFWNLEECPSVKLLSPEEQACENHYTSNTIRDAVTGRYTVSLPFNDQKEKLGESRQIAEKRFLSLERSLNNNHTIKVQYVEFLKEYERLGHMTEVTDESIEGIYLPHHPVVKDSSLTTKVRVVFDASARSSSGVSLNDTLMVGPTIQDDLVSIITRFRLHKYVLTADITKMYRQVDLRAVDRKYQRILWRENSNQTIKTYELNTVTYGTASAPFLAVRTLHQLAHDEIGNHPIAANAFLKDFYVDDVLTGADSFNEAMLLRNELIRLAAKGGFQLRQWVSNEPRLLESFPNASVHDHMVLDASDDKKTLGLYWKAERDVLGYTIKQVEPLQKVTKRTILSRIAQLFDPLGLLGPVIVQAKIMMQGLWKCKLDWDESVPVDIYGAWVNFQSQLPLIQNVHIPRRVISDGHTHLQLHGFCDASEQAYGACIYIRSTRDGQRYSAQLVSSKSKVAPLKTQSLPRLELCGALLLIKLYNIIIKAINLSFEKVVFWSDSMITLHWIRTAPHTLKTFVANRVSQIQQHSAPSQWLHVPSEHNAADILSRGSNIQDFLTATSWFTGPQWLSQSEDTWPHYDMQPIDVPEKRKVVVLHATTNAEVQLLEKFSSFILLQRVIAYCLRFYYNTCHKPKRGGPLTTDELAQAHLRIIGLLQRLVFTKEIHDLSKSEISKCGTRFTALGPFLDEDGLLRVGGRLKHALLPYSAKHPLLLPQNHFLTDLIIREIHVKHGHIGARGTLHAVRQKYWPVNGMTTVKSVLRKCITCHKLTAIVPQYTMGQLPKDRVVLNRPFLVTGVDYCGPFHIKEKKLRNTKKVKTYVAVFVCFSTKAVHLELVSDMTSDAFLAALKRFFARRGKCTDLYSDNGTNFVGASRELQKIRDAILVQDPNDQFHKYLSDQHVRWHFIPPRAPHFGGLWEAAVRSMKHHLIRIVGNTVLTFEGFTTCLAEIEAILNSRPLTPLSSDPNDLSPLTPGHFLIGDSLTSTPECDFTSVNTGRLSSWQHIQQLRQHFWSRWYKEYLNELTVRKKWHDGQTTQISEGMLVILKEDNTPPLCWPMGRIVATHPGEDGVVRVATVRTLTGEYKRSVKRLSPLPVNDD